MNMFAPVARDIELRDYQLQAVEALRDGIRNGRKRQILCAPTGAGKTILAAHLLKEADRKGSYSLFLVDRIALVDQTSAVFDLYGIPHGVVQGIHRRWAPHENVQVASVQTLARRSLPRSPSLIIWDEAHCFHKATQAFVDRHSDAVCIGLTATPFTPGMGEHWSGMVNVRTARALMDEGHLVEPTIYVAKSPQDAELSLSGFGEFTDESATEAGIRIVGDVVSEWVRKTNEHFGGPAKTIVFSPTVEHGRELCAAFKAAGFNFQQISYLDKTDEERADKINEFRKPDSTIHGLVSCGVLTRGFDVPDCLVGISCKPYRKSLSSHMQEIGRVMRPAPGKAKAIWLDHSGNIERLALDMLDVWDNGAGDLSRAAKRDSTARKRDETTREKVVCPECSGVMRVNTCTACGWERPARSGIVSVPGEMRRFDPAEMGGAAPRAGLRADCLSDPRLIWNAAVTYCIGVGARGEEAARKRAYAIWRGIYPGAKLGSGWWNMRPSCRDDRALALIDRETKRDRRRP